MDFPKTYIINLDKDVERLRKVNKQLGEYKISNYQRIPGVYGKDLTEQQIKGVTTDFCSKYCTKSSIGCALSHIKTYETIIANKDPYALILEDDVVFEPNFRELVKQKLARVPKDFDIVYLGCSLCSDTGNIQSYTEFLLSLVFKKEYKNINESVFVPNVAFALHAYIVSNKGARKLQQIFNRGIYSHIDGQIQNERQGMDLSVYVIRPLLVYQDVSTTNTSNQASDYPVSISQLLKNVNDDYRIPESYHYMVPYLEISGIQITRFNIIMGIVGLVAGFFGWVYILWGLSVLFVYEKLLDTKNKNMEKIIHSFIFMCVFYVLGLIIKNMSTKGR